MVSINKVINIIQTITVVADDDENLQDEELAPAYMAISDAREYDDQVEIGDQLADFACHF